MDETSANDELLVLKSNVDIAGWNERIVAGTQAWFREHPILETKIRRALMCTRAEAESAVQEVLKFLCLVAWRSDAGKLTPPHRVDLAWHELILFTRGYAEFCDRWFGQFIHHHPGGSPAEIREQFGRTLTSYRQVFGEPPEWLWGDSAGGRGACGNCEALVSESANFLE